MVFPLGHPGMISKIKMMYNNNNVLFTDVLLLGLAYSNFCFPVVTASFDPWPSRNFNKVFCN